jgi:hypothetical protein
MIARVTAGGLGPFQSLDEQRQTAQRQVAIETIGKECSKSGRFGIVTGHYMF